MKITVMTTDEQFITLDVDPDETVENVKALLEVETSISLQQQQLLFNGKEMRNSERLSSLQVRDGDMVMMASVAASNDLRLNPDGSAVNPRAFQQQIRRDSQLMAQLLQNDPALSQAVVGDNLDDLQNILRERHQQRLELRRKQEEEIALMYADPFDVESQKKIEAAIRQKGIDENWEAALEYNPEAFARVVMLYVDMEVNGVPLKAFVDSGAQSTIISKSCAERCGLLRLLDQRYKGVAVGVGQSEIIGRIHVAPIKDIPSHVRDEERLSKQASLLGQGPSSGTSGAQGKTPGTNTSGTSSSDPTQGADFEAKVQKLVELGFDRNSVIQALKLFNGNEDQAAGFLFG
ncbi:DNA damage-inducible protein 1 [Ananas comosus]|uniref:DNA damage-inducible protein 1 n=1 Tax=Ananas comosus TaxID=4615 RepID=A0A199UMS6_ANACO|nr:DNA damage-inducible protein 1 [Ananas comosus]